MSQGLSLWGFGFFALQGFSGDALDVHAQNGTNPASFLGSMTH